MGKLGGESEKREGGKEKQWKKECVSRMKKKCLVRQKVEMEVNKYRGKKRNMTFLRPCVLVVITAVHSRLKR